VKEETPNFDFWYAVHNTTVIKAPEKRLETFGQTLMPYSLISELMDSVDQVRVREGRIKAFRPEIITPDSMGKANLEGFDEQSKAYMDWLRQNQPELFVLKYGFTINNEGTSDHIIHASLETVVERVQREVTAREDPHAAVLVGVEQPWEVCLLKLMVEMVQSSAPGNMRDLKERQLIPLTGEAALHDEVEQEFRLAARHPGRIPHLGELLHKRGLFERYQDRFFHLLKMHKR